MSATYIWALKMKLNGEVVDVTADVMGDSPKAFSRGIDGTGVTDRVAKVGPFSFVLDNSASNSGGLVGYYSSDHVNCRPGFEVGTEVWLEFCTDFSTLQDEAGEDLLDEDGNYLTIDNNFCKYHGKIADIPPLAGMFKDLTVSIPCVDYMNELLVHNMSKVPVQTGKRSDQVAQVIIANLPNAPLDAEYATDPDTLAYALHDVQDERTSGMNALQRLAQTGLGDAFVRGDFGPSYGPNLLSDGGLENWTTANDLTNWQESGASDATQETVNKYLGNYSAKLLNAGTATYLYQPITALTAGQPYRVSGWLKAGAGDVSLYFWTAGFVPQLACTVPAGTTQYIQQVYYAVGDEVYFLVYNPTPNATAYADALALQKITYYPSGGEHFTWQARDTRFDLQSVATFDNSMTDLKVTRKADKIYNSLQATGQTVKLGTTNEVLWTSQKEIVLGPGQTQLVDARYTDPSGAGRRITIVPGTEVTPVADTDYRMSSSAGGSGNDKNAKLTIVINGGKTPWGGNLTTISLTNTDAATGYVNLLQLRAHIIRLYDPQTNTSTDEASRKKYGDRPLPLVFPYQDNIHAIAAFSTSLLARLKDPHTSIESVEFMANVDDATMALAMACDVGQKITLSESVTGFTAQEFVIGTYDLVIDKGTVTCKLGSLERSAVWNDIGAWEEAPSASDVAAYDAVTNISSGAATGHSFSTVHTPVGTPSLIIVGLATFGALDTTPSVFYGGVAMNYLGTEGISSRNISFYYLLAPPSGAQTVSGNWAVGNNMPYKVSCVSITNATTLCASGHAAGSGGTAAKTINVKPNGIMVGALVADGTYGSMAAEDTEVTNDHDENPWLFVAYTLTIADGTDTVGWTNAPLWWGEFVASFYTA